MDDATKSYIIHLDQALTPPKVQQSSIFESPFHSSNNGFPILAIAIIGIIATAFLLVSYYIFVIKCCLNWHRIDLLRRFSFSRNSTQEETLMVYSPVVENRGLNESVIRSIPIFQYKKGEKVKNIGEKSFSECSVCLTEFQEEEKLRVLPNCSHLFHIDCIDTWLQGNANCPLCRSTISVTTRFPIDQIIAPRSSPQDSNPYTDDFIVIELGHENSDGQSLMGRCERSGSGEFSISPSPRKLQRKISNKKGKKLHHGSSMGDECIDIRAKDEEFAVQPIRRSFSMDSSVDRQLYLSVQEMLQRQNITNGEVICSIEGCSSRLRRSLFSFGHGRGSRNAVLPVHLET